MSQRVSLKSVGIRRVLDVLRTANEPLHGDAIADRAFISRRTFCNCYYKVLLDAKEIHVAQWLRNVSGPYIPLYAIGSGPSVPKPRKLSNAEISRRWKDKTGYDEMRKAQARLVRPVDTTLAALLGIPSKGKHFKNTTNGAAGAGKEQEATQ